MTFTKHQPTGTARINIPYQAKKNELFIAEKKSANV
jgi:hypothetical protein